MFRLRTTTTLSLLALAIGIAGTQWLSTLTAGWAGPTDRMAGFMATPHRAAPSRIVAHHATRTAWHVVTRRAPAVAAEASPVDAQASELALPELVPVSMPSAAVPYANLQGHLRGRVLVHVRVDGNGRVADAALTESSGDPVLDAHALATVRQWRFAVPADHPDGLSGDLPMRFTVGDTALAQAR